MVRITFQIEIFHSGSNFKGNTVTHILYTDTYHRTLQGMKYVLIEISDLSNRFKGLSLQELPGLGQFGKRCVVTCEASF